MSTIDIVIRLKEPSVTSWRWTASTMADTRLMCRCLRTGSNNMQINKQPIFHALWLVLICGATTVSCRQSTDAPQRPAASYVVDAITVVPRTIRETLSATGTLLARESVVLQAERAGIVREILFEEGQPAAAGEILVVMDDSELQAQLSRATAELDLATAIEMRDRELFSTGSLISEADYEQTLANLGVASAEKTLIEAQVAKTRIRALSTGSPVCGR
jgi:multidrug efflux pump subunit AcrA (membrane-fusion protein)